MSIDEGLCTPSPSLLTAQSLYQSRECPQNPAGGAGYGGGGYGGGDRACYKVRPPAATVAFGCSRTDVRVLSATRLVTSRAIAPRTPVDKVDTVEEVTALATRFAY